MATTQSIKNSYVYYFGFPPISADTSKSQLKQNPIQMSTSIEKPIQAIVVDIADHEPDMPSLASHSTTKVKTVVKGDKFPQVKVTKNKSQLVVEQIMEAKTPSSTKKIEPLRDYRTQDGKNYQCPIKKCNRVFKRKNHFLAHIQQKHPKFAQNLDLLPTFRESVYSCSFDNCQSRYWSKKDLTLHIKKMHSPDTSPTNTHPPSPLMIDDETDDTAALLLKLSGSVL